MVFLTICDVHYNFIAIDIGEYRSNNDCGVLLNSRMGRKFEQSRFNIPPPEALHVLDGAVPFFLVGDELFRPKEWRMRSFAGKQLINEMRKAFNYKLSGARAIIENTFGILVLRWRIFQKPMEEKPELIEKNVLAAMGLHNYLKQTNDAHYTPAGFADSEDKSAAIIEAQWRRLIDSNLQSVRPIRNSRYAKNTLYLEKSYQISLFKKIVRFLGNVTESEEQGIN